MPGTENSNKRSSMLATYLRTLREKRDMTINRTATQIERDPWIVWALENDQVKRPDPRDVWAIVTALEGDFYKALAFLAMDAGVPTEAFEMEEFRNMERRESRLAS